MRRAVPVPAIRPMPLARVPQPFDHPAWIFEPKLDGFRALAYVEHDAVTLVSRNGRPFGRFPGICTAIRDAVKAETAVLDGELVCHGDDGLPDFRRLLYRRAEPDFYAFDLLALDGRDLRDRPLLERKHLLRRAVSRIRDGRVHYVDHVGGSGVELFRFAVAHDLEGVVAKWRRGTYRSDGRVTSWLKVKNRDYTQARDRHELFNGWRPRRSLPELERGLRAGDRP